jgi:hypothetical protein
VIETISKSEASERGWEVIYWAIEVSSKHDLGKRGRERVGEGLVVLTSMKEQVSEGDWELGEWLVKFRKMVEC